jgi:glycosyltransferase involved in cell wall biosynthesis
MPSRTELFGGRNLLNRFKAIEPESDSCMRILFVHEVSWFSKVVYEIHDIPELLSLNGHEVHFLEFEENNSRAHWKSVVTTETRSHAGSKVGVISPPHIFSGILRRLAAIVIQPLVFIQQLKTINPDVVVTYSIPTSGWQVVAICRRKGIPVVVRAIDVSHKLRKTKFEGAIKRAERFVYSHADHVCANNEALRKYCIRLGASPTRSSVIYPGIDLERFTPAPPDVDLQIQLGIQPTDRVLIFMGTIFRFSGLVELLTELAHSLRKDPTVKFLILGDGEDFNRLKQHATVLGLQNQVLMPGRIEYDSLANYLHLGTVALLPFKQELVTHGALPGKVLQYLACGLPTISTPLDGLMSMIPPANGVIFANDLAEMAILAIDLVRNPYQRQGISDSGINLMTELCNWNYQITKFERLLGSLTRA